MVNSGWLAAIIRSIRRGKSDVYANAFENNGNWSVTLTNRNDFSVLDSFPPSGNLPATAETVLYTNGITDNNENSNSVTIGPLPGGISVTGNTVTLTLPPLSVVSLLPPSTLNSTQRTAATAAPVGRAEKSASSSRRRPVFLTVVYRRFGRLNAQRNWFPGMLTGMIFAL